MRSAILLASFLAFSNLGLSAQQLVTAAPSSVSAPAGFPDSPGYLWLATGRHRSDNAQVAVPASPQPRTSDSAMGPAAADLVFQRHPEGFHWAAAAGQSLAWFAIQSFGNVTMDYWGRYNLFHGNFFRKWFQSVQHFRFSRWNDDDTIVCNYIGHPIMGAVLGDIQIQNDPSGRVLRFEMSRRYWHSRLKAMAWSAMWSAEWKVGPISEASIGNTGISYYYDKDARKITNGTGMVDFFVTPIGGTVWLMGEDVVDRYIVEPVERKSTRRLLLLALPWLTPGRSAANIMRGRAPWYRDSRDVHWGKRNSKTLAQKH
jgi:hypothetical protein